MQGLPKDKQTELLRIIRELLNSSRQTVKESLDRMIRERQND